VSTVLSPRAYAVRCPLRAGEQLVDHEMLFAISGVYWNKLCHQSITREKTGDIIGYSGRTEETKITSRPEKMEAVRIVEDLERAIEEAEKDREGLTIFTDGSRLESGATGYAVAWKAGNRWVGVKAHMGYNQEAFDAECAALTRALEVAAKRRTGPKAVTVFTDSQAAMARIASEEPGPAQQYARQARKWIAKLRERDRNVRIEIRWCPAHSGVTGNEEADK